MRNKKFDAVQFMRQTRDEMSAVCLAGNPPQARLASRPQVWFIPSPKATCMPRYN
jgi:hypothetical protein